MTQRIHIAYWDETRERDPGRGSGEHDGEGRRSGRRASSGGGNRLGVEDSANRIGSEGTWMLCYVPFPLGQRSVRCVIMCIPCDRMWAAKGDDRVRV